MKVQAKSLLVVALCGLATGSTLAEPKANYVGQGRYSCSGTAVECAQINSNNDRNAEWNRRRHQEEQDRAQRYVEENRRREHWEKRGVQ